MFTDRVIVGTNAGDDILALLLKGNSLVDDVHSLADTLVDWGASLGFKRLVLDPTGVDEIGRCNNFFDNWRLDNCSWGYGLNYWSSLDNRTTSHWENFINDNLGSGPRCRRYQ